MCFCWVLHWLMLLMQSISILCCKFAESMKWFRYCKYDWTIFNISKHFSGQFKWIILKHAKQENWKTNKLARNTLKCNPSFKKRSNWCFQQIEQLLNINRLNIENTIIPWPQQKLLAVKVKNLGQWVSTSHGHWGWWGWYHPLARESSPHFQIRHLISSSNLGFQNKQSK